jgi:hypothetical protein
MTARPVIDTIRHAVDRLEVAVGVSFEDFRGRYERAVPRLDVERFEQLVKDDADWDTVLRATAENAPYDFIIYWSFDVTSLMRLAGDRGRCVEYLMGNHTIAERMYRYEPAVMLYAPLRTAIYEGADGTAWFTIDQPSTRFVSFGIPAITEVGMELDHKLAALLEHLGAPVPAVLTAGAPTAPHPDSRQASG